MIDEVISFRAKLESRPFIDCELLKQVEIPILKTGPVDLVPNTRLQIERTRRGRGEYGLSVAVGWVEIFGVSSIAAKLLRHRRSPVSHPELTFGGVAATAEASHFSYAGVIVTAAAHSAGGATLKLGVAAERPAAKQFTSQRLL